jgi:hypothetical protein
MLLRLGGEVVLLKCGDVLKVVLKGDASTRVSI